MPEILNEVRSGDGTWDEIRSFIESGSSENVGILEEYGPEAVATVCALANSHGGTVILGVAQQNGDYLLAGINRTAGQIFDLLVYDLIPLPPDIRVESVVFEDVKTGEHRDLGVIYVSRAPKLITVRTGEAYIRDGAANVVAPAETDREGTAREPEPIPLPETPLAPQEMVDTLIARLNETEVPPYTEGWGAVREVVRQMEPLLGTEQRELLGAFAALFMLRVDRRHLTDPDRYARFSGLAPANRPTDVWELAWKVAGNLKHPVLGPYLDDLLLVNRDALKQVPGFDFKALFLRTIERYLQQAQWLAAMPDKNDARFRDLALSDALSRATQLALQFRQEAQLERALELLRSIAKEERDEKRWRWLLDYVEIYVLVAENKQFARLLEKDERETCAKWAEEAAEELTRAGMLIHLVGEANTLAARLRRQPGDADPFSASRRTTAEQIARAARTRGAKGENLAASFMMNQAIALAHKSGDLELAERLNAEKVEFMRQAGKAGEMKEHGVELRLEEEEWERFLAPYRNAGTPDEALLLFLGNPSFIPDQEALKLHHRSSGFLAGRIFPTVLISGMGLQTAGPGQSQAGEDLDALVSIGRHIQLMAGLYMSPLLAYLHSEKGVETDHVMARLESWELMSESNLPIIRRGVERHFEKDWISSIHILVPQFEATLRRAFYLAGYPSAMDYDFSDDKGLSQKERTFGSFLNSENVKTALGPLLHRHFTFVFTDRHGLNLRNDVAHGLVAPGTLSSGISALVVHCILSLTRLAKGKSK